VNYGKTGILASFDRPKGGRQFGKINVFCRIHHHILWPIGVSEHKMLNQGGRVGLVPPPLL
jgi:hypothetical protein